MSHDDDTPVCPVCKTETIAALHGQLRCLDCHRVWDGSERGPIDLFGPAPIPADEMTTQDVVLDILARMWRGGLIEAGMARG